MKMVFHGKHERRVYAACLAFAFVVPTACNKPVSKDVAATVNGRAITYTELDRTVAAQLQSEPAKGGAETTTMLRMETLRALIGNEIMVQRAEKAGLLASDADVDARFNEAKVAYTQEQFTKRLEERHMTQADFRAQIRRELSILKLLNKEIGSHISISDADVTAYYETNKSTFNLPEAKIHIAQILVTPAADSTVNNLRNDKARDDKQAVTKIQSIELRIRKGEDFATLAQGYSEDAISAPNGGDLGFVPEPSLDKANPELRKLILGMTPGQVSPVIHTPEGYRIIKLISREPAGQRQLSDPRVQEEIRQGLFQGKEQILRSAFDEVARNETKIVNYYAQSVLASRDKH